MIEYQTCRRKYCLRWSFVVLALILVGFVLGMVLAANYVRVMV